MPLLLSNWVKGASAKIGKPVAEFVLDSPAFFLTKVILAFIIVKNLYLALPYLLQFPSTYLLGSFASTRENRENCLQISKKKVDKK